MSDIVPLLNAIAADSSLAGWSASVGYVPEVDVATATSRRCVVTPTDVEYVSASRGTIISKYTVQLGFIYRNRQADVGELLDAMHSIAEAFMNRRVGDYSCTSAAHVQLFSQDSMREKNLFTSIMELTFQK